jgi:hypothetical protein
MATVSCTEVTLRLVLVHAMMMFLYAPVDYYPYGSFRRRFLRFFLSSQCFFQSKKPSSVSCIGLS